MNRIIECLHSVVVTGRGESPTVKVNRSDGAPFPRRREKDRGRAAQPSRRALADAARILGIDVAEMSVPVIFVTSFPERPLTGERPERTFLVTKPFDAATPTVTMSQALLTGGAAPRRATG